MLQLFSSHIKRFVRYINQSVSAVRSFYLILVSFRIPDFDISVIKWNNQFSFNRYYAPLSVLFYDKTIADRICFNIVPGSRECDFIFDIFQAVSEVTFQSFFKTLIIRNILTFQKQIKIIPFAPFSAFVVERFFLETLSPNGKIFTRKIFYPCADFAVISINQIQYSLLEIFSKVIQLFQIPQMQIIIYSILERRNIVSVKSNKNFRNNNILVRRFFNYLFDFLAGIFHAHYIQIVIKIL